VRVSPTGPYERIAAEALRSYALDVQTLTLVADDWNTTFMAETATGDAYGVRVYLPDRRSDDEIRTEVAWLEALSIDRVARVPDPIWTQGGSPFVRAGAGEASRRVAVFRWVPGNQLGDDPPPHLVSAFGEGVARLHVHGRSFDGADGLRVWDRCFPHGGGALFDDGNADVVEPASRSVFERARAATEAAIERLRRGEPPRIVHGDLHQDNVLVDDDDLWFIDFDDCALAWPVQDIGVSMWEIGEDEATWPLREAFREGYERVAPWPERRPGEVATFAAWRALLKADDSVRTRAEQDMAVYVQRRADAIANLLDSAGVP
jgi:Ser/Thr protein kinase RdoA (MazF antagonist)